MKLEILISTNNEKIHDIQKILLPPMKNISYLISHQVYDGKEYEFNSERKDVRYIKSNERGLSKNRNVSLLKALGEICIISDDDVSYEKEYLNNIFKAFKKNSDADIITFKVKTKPSEPKFKKYPNFAFKHNLRTIFQVSSIEIAFRLKSIKKVNLKFDENFGLGAKFYYGEENIFLVDALKKGLKIKYIPYHVVNHSYERSGTSFKYKNEDIITFGALSYRIFGFFGILFDIYGTFYNFNQYKFQISFFNFLKRSFQGSVLAFKTLNLKKKHSITTLSKLFSNYLRNIAILYKKNRNNKVD